MEHLFIADTNLFFEAQRLEDLNLPFYYYENIDGGHAGAANLEETAHSQALTYSYLASKLMED